MVELMARIRSALLVLPALVLVACGGDPTSDPLTAQGDAEVNAEQSNTFTPTDVEPVRIAADKFREPAHDPGLNVDFHFQGTRAGDYGGTVVAVAVTNRNDVPLPPEYLSSTTLRYGDNRTEASLFNTTTPDGVPPLQLPLDLPLGVGATTNLHFTYDVSRSNLGSAEFQIGNVIFEGNLIT